MKFSQKGDQGETSLLGGERISKADLRPETYGTLDEASAILGLARANTTDQKVKEIVFDIQKDFLILGAELSISSRSNDEYTYEIGREHVERMEDLIDELQEEVELPQSFIYPGDTMVSAIIDMARSTVRRAERRAVKLKEENLINNPEILRYLNRCSDLLFALARYQEKKEGKKQT